MTAAEFIAKLDELGYFEYTEESKLSLVKESMTKHFTNEDFMTAFSRNPPYQSVDLRIYSCGDGEELFEEGGAISLIKEMRPLLDKIGVQINYSNDNYIGNQHTIVINGRTYVLAKGSPLLWGETIVKFAEMINAELELLKSKERIYLMTNENVYMVFLTLEQYQTVSANFSYDKRPLTVNEWTTKTLDEISRIMNRQ